MENSIQKNILTKKTTSNFKIVNPILIGMTGGMAATVVMDLILMGILTAAGLPTLACFSIVGDTLARAFSSLGMGLTGSILLGVAGHYLIGPSIGAIFGALITRMGFRQMDTTLKVVGFAVLYSEIVSQPILAMTPYFLKMTTTETLQWFGESFVMHLIWGIVMGLVVSHGLKNDQQKQ